jgi:hypothetical protein
MFDPAVAAVVVVEAVVLVRFPCLFFILHFFLVVGVEAN